MLTRRRRDFRKVVLLQRMFEKENKPKAVQGFLIRNEMLSDVM